MFVFRRRYFLLTLLFFLTEVLIAVFVNDRFVRPYLGDFLVVILIYCFVRAFFSVSVITSAIAVLLFAYLVECSQYFHLITLLRLEHSAVARAILGWSFAWEDMLAYTLGVGAVLAVEYYAGGRRLTR